MMFRNERALYKRKSSYSGKDVFATYPEDVPFPVYLQEEWFSDKWDPMDYGKEYDFSRPFFEQFLELSNNVPKPAKSALRMVNSEYSNNAVGLKNCYLIFNSGYSEDCGYGNGVSFSKNCFDNSDVNYGELCYEVFNSARCSSVFFSMGIVDSHDIYFSKNLRGCINCFGCVNLRNKSYCWFNEQLNKDEYKKRIEKYKLDSYKVLQELLEKTYSFWLKFPNRFAEHGSRSVDVVGDYIYQGKNVKYTYKSVGG